MSVNERKGIFMDYMEFWGIQIIEIDRHGKIRYVR
jgi:hypothetical protein